MTSRAAARASPRDRIAAAAAVHGAGALVAACVRLLGGDEVDDELVVALGGAHASRFLAGPDRDYWGRVWGARGLLYVWDDAAASALVEAASDPSWRVRELVAKVVAKRRVDDAAGTVARLQGDPVPRVRAAAERALVALGHEGGPSGRRAGPGGERHGH